MNDNRQIGAEILQGLISHAAVGTCQHDSMSPSEIKEWNELLAKEREEEEQRMLDYD